MTIRGDRDASVRNSRVAVSSTRQPNLIFYVQDLIRRGEERRDLAVLILVGGLSSRARTELQRAVC